MTNHDRVEKLSFVLSSVSFVTFLAGFILFLEKGLWFLPLACREKRLMFIAAPLLALASLVIGAMAGHEPTVTRWFRILFRTLATAVLVFAGLLTPPPLMLPLRLECSQPSGESMAINWLHSLNDAISVHLTLRHDLPESLDELGILDELRETNRNRGWKMDYIFTYTVGAPEANGTRRRYTIVARPIRFGENGNQNFFTDETGVVRFTTQDRPVTANDCRVEDWQACKPR